jgi:serine/threonine-protein kinase
VYQAFDELLKVRLAMKLIRPELAVRKTVLKLLYRELVIARRVNHPNVCRVYDIGLEDGLHFFTMELVKGETLDDLLARTTVPPETARDCLIQIALALEAAHAAGVIHRDLKPGNVMVDTKGHVTVMDFGLARDLVSDQSIVQGPVGTPAYWAPEQALGQQVTPASDVYAFGLIALRLFGIRSRTEAGLATAPLLYRDLLARCLAPPPTERYASGRELREALVTLHARVVAAPPLSVARVDELAETQAFRRPSRITRVAALGAVFVAGALAGAWLLSRAPHVESAAPPPSVLAPGAAPTTAPQPTPASAATLTSAPVAAPASASTRPASSDGAPPRRPRPPSAKPPKPAPTTEIPVLE